MTTGAVAEFKLLLPLSMLFTAVLLVSNTVAVKIVSLGSFTFDAATLLFPLAYILGDIFTEVYGYKASRKIIWYAILAQTLMAGMYMLVQILPSADFWSNQEAYDLILGTTPRIVLASLIAFFTGELSNAYILSRMKVKSNGRHLPLRTIGSTLVGQAVDTVIFVCIAFAGVFSTEELYVMLLSNYVFKVAFEVLCTPLTVSAIRYVKRYEKYDAIDSHISYNPFTS